MPCLCYDYKEVVKLALIYIGIKPLQSFTPQCPGTVSKARLIGKVI